MDNLFIIFVLSFLIGSIPTGVIIAKIKGVDLRKVGSGNIGATNVLRAMGKEAAILTLLGDMGKGIFAVYLARVLMTSTDYQILNTFLIPYLTQPRQFLEGIVGIIAILGHNYSLFLKFKGGKGVATSLGVLFALSPQAALITITIWLFTLARSGYSSLSSLVSFGVLPLVIFIVDRSNEKILIAFAIAILIIIRHISNIKRLVAGTENKVFKK
ncbi:MAG: glycerol-3-phosphate 1-O-acyltransferase PlsY [Thermodesulfovibrionales bacterium]|nr:glycerol-3-phosphate 1-O-acyltransferase PlsY [Thermodesulfovibrionales bacterium]